MRITSEYKTLVYDIQNTAGQTRTTFWTVRYFGIGIRHMLVSAVSTAVLYPMTISLCILSLLVRSHRYLPKKSSPDLLLNIFSFSIPTDSS